MEPPTKITGMPFSQPAASAGAGASRYLLFYSVCGYVLAFVFIVWIGFIEIYVNKATFGATPWSDYLTLILAGFGAEPTRASVLGVARTWELPG